MTSPRSRAGRARVGLCSLALVALAGGCAVVPTGPSQLALPGTGKTFEQFRFDDNDCRGYAFTQSGARTAEQAAADSAGRSAVVGTVIGAAAGAALGGSHGAAVGAGVGLVGGSAVGVDAANQSSWTAQRRYDHGYIQCMYAKGHRVPVSGRFTTVESPRRVTTTPPPAPPPGAPPPPPTGQLAPRG